MKPMAMSSRWAAKKKLLKCPKTDMTVYQIRYRKYCPERERERDKRERERQTHQNSVNCPTTGAHHSRQNEQATTW